MKIRDAFRFCPRCGGNFAKKSAFLECSDCQLKYYLNPKPGIVVLLEGPKNEYILVTRANKPKKGYWDLPGGFVDLNETYEEAVRREVKEELGADIERLEYLTSVVDSYYYQGIDYQVTVAIFKGKVARSAAMVAADDIESFAFFKAKDLPTERIAFASTQRALDYLKSSGRP